MYINHYITIQMCKSGMNCFTKEGRLAQIFYQYTKSFCATSLYNFLKFYNIWFRAQFTQDNIIFQNEVQCTLNHMPVSIGKRRFLLRNKKKTTQN